MFAVPRVGSRMGDENVEPIRSTANLSTPYAAKRDSSRPTLPHKRKLGMAGL